MPALPPRQHTRLKCISMGDEGVGNSCLIKRYCEEKFVSKYISTIGVDFGVKPVKLGGQSVRVNFWDLAGGDEYFEIRNEFYKDCNCALLVYDVNERASFESLERWLKEAAQHGAKNPVYAVCANKADGGAAKRRAVGEAEGRKWAADRKMGYFETSAKDGDGVGALFESLFSQAMAR